MSAYVTHLEPDLEAVAALFKTLSHPSRLLICCQLLDGPMNVAAMEATLNLKQPNLSRELSKLRSEGVVSAARESGSVTYTIADPRVAWLLDAYRHQGAQSPQSQQSPQAMQSPQAVQSHTGKKIPGVPYSPFQGGGAMFARTFPENEEV